MEHEYSTYVVVIYYGTTEERVNVLPLIYDRSSAIFEILKEDRNLIFHFDDFFVYKNGDPKYCGIYIYHGEETQDDEGNPYFIVEDIECLTNLTEKGFLFSNQEVTLENFEFIFGVFNTKDKMEFRQDMSGWVQDIMGAEPDKVFDIADIQVSLENLDQVPKEELLDAYYNYLMSSPHKPSFIPTHVFKKVRLKI